MRNSFIGTSLAPCLALLAGGNGIVACSSAALDWRMHASFRASGTATEAKVAPIEPGEVVRGAVSKNRDYVSIGFDAIYFRDLPGLADGIVALGIEIDGALEGKKLRAIIDVKEFAAARSHILFENVLPFEPFLYEGRPITLTLHLRSLPRRLAPIVRAASAAKLAGRIDPHRRDVTDRVGTEFAKYLGTLAGSGRSWTYSFTLFPADTTHRDKPELLFTATRHILVAVPPIDAPAPVRDRLNPYKVVEHVRMRGNRLVDARTNAEYTASPYLVLNITRFKRYPKADTPLVLLTKKIEKWLEEGTLDAVGGMLKEVNVAIATDTVLTSREKNYEKMRNDVREVELSALVAQRKAAAAERAGDMAAAGRGWDDVVGHRLRQIKLLTALLSEHAEILEPFEVDQIAGEVRRLASRTEGLLQKLARDVSEIKAAVAELDMRLVQMKKADEEQDRKIRDLKLGQDKLRRDMEERMQALMTLHEKNSMRAVYRPKWFEKPWFWSVVTVGTLAATGTVLYFTVFKKGDVDGRPGSTLPNPGGLTSAP